MTEHQFDIILEHKTIQINDISEHIFEGLLKDLMAPINIPPSSIKNNTHPTDEWTLNEWALYHTLVVATSGICFKVSSTGERLEVNDYSACRKVYDYYINMGLTKNEIAGF